MCKGALPIVIPLSKRGGRVAAQMCLITSSKNSGKLRMAAKGFVPPRSACATSTSRGSGGASVLLLFDLGAALEDPLVLFLVLVSFSSKSWTFPLSLEPTVTVLRLILLNLSLH